MKTITIDGYTLGIVRSKYAMNLDTALILVDTEDYCDFADITVNLGDFLPDDQAYIDVNGYKKIEDVMKKYGLGEPTGKTKISGYVEYPLYNLKLDKIAEYEIAEM